MSKPDSKHLFLLAALCLVIIGVLSGLQVPVPPIFGLAALSALTGGAGLSLPSVLPNTNTTTTTTIEPGPPARVQISEQPAAVIDTSDPGA
jgi:hypothetical protein